jgi:hypothetical protein
MDVAPLTIAQTDCEQSKKPMSFTHMTLPPDTPMPLPESLYDYLPRHEEVSTQPVARSVGHKVCIYHGFNHLARVAHPTRRVLMIV